MSHRVTSLSHTADVGFRVEASSLDELFAGAAWGLSAALTDTEPAALARRSAAESGGGASAGTDRLEISRPDRERLLVAWLRELLHRALSEGLVPAAVDVDLDGGGRLAAEILWRPPDRSPELVREIKGVTYHGLAVRQTAEGWTARVVLDV